MIKSTKNYDMFKFREDNREMIMPSHVEKLAKSIQARNLLEMRPILVNAEMEIIDGQNRLLAAKKLGVPIFYEVKADLIGSDIIALNTAKAWGNSDFMNYYVKNGYPEYVKLKDFMMKHSISLRIALMIVAGKTGDRIKNFREGRFVFGDAPCENAVQIVWSTIDAVKKVNGHEKYLDGAKFWNAMLKMISSVRFDYEKWMKNVPQMIEKFGPRVSEDGYYKMLVDIHNWRNLNKITMAMDGEE